MLDKRDLTYHIGEEGGRAVKVAESRFAENEGAELSLAGEQCWLQFVAFDVRLPFRLFYSTQFSYSLDLRCLRIGAVRKRPRC